MTNTIANGSVSISQIAHPFSSSFSPFQLSPSKMDAEIEKKKTNLEKLMTRFLFDVSEKGIFVNILMTLLKKREGILDAATIVHCALNMAAANEIRQWLLWKTGSFLFGGRYFYRYILWRSLWAHRGSEENQELNAFCQLSVVSCQLPD